MDPPQLPWQTFDGQPTLNLSSAAAAAASQFYMQDYINSGGSGFNSFQQLHGNYPSLPSAESTSTTPASTSSVSPGTIGSISSISSIGIQPPSLKQQNGVTKQKAQRKRKKKDPNEPQKPVSAYALFFRDSQSNIKSQNPNATFGQISKIVASMWDQLDTERKEIYKKKTESAKKEYLKALAAYRASLVQSPQTSTSPQQGFSQTNGNIGGMAMPMAMGSQAMANLANFSQMNTAHWAQDSAKLGFAAQNWPPAAHSNSNMHSMYLGSQMHALSSQLGMSSPWDHRAR